MPRNLLSVLCLVLLAACGSNNSESPANKDEEIRSQTSKAKAVLKTTSQEFLDLKSDFDIVAAEFLAAEALYAPKLYGKTDVAKVLIEFMDIYSTNASKAANITKSDAAEEQQSVKLEMESLTKSVDDELLKWRIPSLLEALWKADPGAKSSLKSAAEKLEVTKSKIISAAAVLK